MLIKFAIVHKTLRHKTHLGSFRIGSPDEIRHNIVHSKEAGTFQLVYITIFGRG